MITSAERRRLEAAYMPREDTRAVLHLSAAGLLAVFIISLAAAVSTAPSDSAVGRISAPQAANGH